MAGFSMYSCSRESRDTEGLVNSTHQGIDRCASLLRALLSPTKIQDKHRTTKLNHPSVKVTGHQSLKRGNKDCLLDSANHDFFVSTLRKVQTPCDNIRYCSVNKKHLHNKKLTPTTTTAGKIKKTALEGNKKQTLPSSTKDNKKGHKKRPVPVAMSTPQKKLAKNVPIRLAGSREHLPPRHANQQQPPAGLPPGLPPMYPTDGPMYPVDGPIYPNDGPMYPTDGPMYPQATDGPQYIPPWAPPYMWLPPCYHHMPFPPLPGGQLPHGSIPHNDKSTQPGVFMELTTKLKLSQKALEEAQQKIKKFGEEKMSLQKQYTDDIKKINETHKKEKDILTEKLSRLEDNLKDIEIKWKEKYCEEAELQHKELCEENQMLTLSLAEKDTELLQSQDTLLSIRQYLAHLLLKLQPSDDKNWSLIPQKDILTLQTIINTGHIDNDSTANSSSTLGQTSPSGGIPVTPTAQTCSTAWTTSTEVDFRRDLATLDADIARLQIQFDVASQNEQK